MQFPVLEELTREMYLAKVRLMQFLTTVGVSYDIQGAPCLSDVVIDGTDPTITYLSLSRTMVVEQFWQFIRTDSIVG